MCSHLANVGLETSSDTEMKNKIRKSKQNGDYVIEIVVEQILPLYY